MKKSLPRLEYIESKLFWEGRVHRRDLVRDCNVSKPQATLDLKEYCEMFPDNIQYTRSRDYVPTKDFTPRLIDPNASQFLSSLLLHARGKGGFNPKFGPPPPIAFTGRVVYPNAHVLRDMTVAIRSKAKVVVTYLSPGRSVPPTFREVILEGFIYDGIEWLLQASSHHHTPAGVLYLSGILDCATIIPNPKELTR